MYLAGCHPLYEKPETRREAPALSLARDLTIPGV